MTNETRLAFAHPSERAEASATDLCDRISLRDYVVEVEIGAFQQERGTLQRVRFNIVVEVSPLTGPIDDDVDRILSYDRVTEAIGVELQAERINLLETLAARVAERIFVVFLSNEAIASAGLKGWIDQVAAMDAPLILAVGAADIAVAQTGHAMTQRRIDLLAIEQNAWALAAKDHRCKVVETRTELDWAMKNGQICIWAPSKIVLDAVDGPSAGPRDAESLVAWFAAEMLAKELVLIGAAAPDCKIPTRVVPVTSKTL